MGHFSYERVRANDFERLVRYEGANALERDGEGGREGGRRVKEHSCMNPLRKVETIVSK